MELEEAIIFLMKIAKEYKIYGDLDNPEFEDIKKIPEAIQTVLKALKDKNKEIYKLDKKFQYAVPDDIIDELYITKEKVKDMIKNESIVISGFECIAVEDLKKMLEDK